MGVLWTFWYLAPVLLSLPLLQIVLDPRFEKKWMRARSRKALKDVIINADRKREI